MIQAFETECLRKLLCVSFFEHKTNDWWLRNISFLEGPQQPFLATVKRRKLAWFGHVTRRESFSKSILQGAFEGGRHCGRQRKYWMDNVKELASLGLLLNRLPCPSDDPIGERAKLN